MHTVQIGEMRFDGSRPLLIAGPCVIENEADTLGLARRIAELQAVAHFDFVFKASYSKDNRSAAGSFRGVGLDDGLAILARVRDAIGCPVLSDVHSVADVIAAAEVLDVLQIPAFLSRQTALLEAAGASGKAVNIKKGQFLSAEGVILSAEKVQGAGNDNILLTERGTTFGYGDLVVDFRAFARMQASQHPVIFDVTHSLQRPGGLGDRSGGEPALAGMMARAAAAVPVDGFFIETHPDPVSAASDAASMLPLDQLSAVLNDTRRIFELARELPGSEH